MDMILSLIINGIIAIASLIDLGPLPANRSPMTVVVPALEAPLDCHVEGCDVDDEPAETAPIEEIMEP